MSETTSGAYCQQWTAICGATGICDAVFETGPTTVTETGQAITTQSPTVETSTAGKQKFGGSL